MKVENRGGKRVGAGRKPKTEEIKLIRKLTPLERMSSRIGYMGSGFLMISPYLLPYDGIGAYTYLMGALLSLPQVWIAKQWNIVLLNFNLLVGYGIYIFQL